MSVKTKYVEVVVGKNQSRHTVGDSFVKDIGIDAQTGWLLVYMENGDTHAFNTKCPWMICTHDDGIVVPEIITDVTQ